MKSQNHKKGLKPIFDFTCGRENYGRLTSFSLGIPCIGTKHPQNPLFGYRKSSMFMDSPIKTKRRFGANLLLDSRNLIETKSTSSMRRIAVIV
jgi:hypothetical protein